MTDYVIPLDGIGNGESLEDANPAAQQVTLNHLAFAGIRVPAGFTTTAQAYRAFLEYNDLNERIAEALSGWDGQDHGLLSGISSQIRQWIVEAQMPPDLEQAIRDAFAQVIGDEQQLAVAVRATVTDECLADAAFAGLAETFLNIRGMDNIIPAVKGVFAGMFSDRAIIYRHHQGFGYQQCLLAACIQRMVRSDIGASGELLTLDGKSGFRDVIFIRASYGLGAMTLRGMINPDEYYVHKPTLAAGRLAILRRGLGTKAKKLICDESGQVGQSVQLVEVPRDDRRCFALTDAQINQLASQALAIENHYGRPVNVEWALDGDDGELYILDVQVETIKPQASNTAMKRYLLRENGKVLLEGRGILQRIGAGPVRVIKDTSEIGKVQPGDVLVTDMTDPDWEPAMRKAAAVITNRGGRTCHAAIVARELGIPALVGCGQAINQLKDGQRVTVSCVEGGMGYVFEGELDFDVTTNAIKAMPELPFKIMMNVANPDRAFELCQLPNAGIGVARLEFIINRMIGVHPKAILSYASLPPDVQESVKRRVCGYASPVDFYVEKLVEGISTLGAAFAPKKVIVRLSDFKSNEYGNLIGGKLFEPVEENPMLGFRGVSRYISDTFRDCFELECRALKKVREEMGLTNVEIMVPFVRTLGEATQVIDMLATFGLKRGENGLRLIMMCELPSNALLAEEFLEYFDGFSIGSNDMTQLTLGLDRDSGIIAHLFDERNPGVKKLMAQVIQACKATGKYIGICGQGPSDHPDLAKWLMEQGIDSISLSPDTVLDTWFFLAKGKDHLHPDEDQPS